MRSVALLLGALLLASCGERVSADGKIALVFNDLCYRVPEWNARLIEASAFPPFREPRKTTQTVSLRFRNADIRARIPEYEWPLTVQGDPIDDINVLFFAPTPEQLAQTRRNQDLKRRTQFISLWYAEGDWTSRTIEPSPVPGLYRVYFYRDNHSSWQVVTRLPDMKSRDTHLDPGFHLSGCHTIGSGSDTRCGLNMEDDGVFLDSSTSEANLPLREKLKPYFLETLESWRVACEG